MNEIGILREQMATEQSHAAQVAATCAAVFGSDAPVKATAESLQALREACVAYLVWVLARFEERDQSLSDRLRSLRQAGSGGQRAPDPQALSEVIARPGTSREALARLEAAVAVSASHRDAVAARRAWRRFSEFFDSAWKPRRSALDALLAELSSVADWRAVCAIDADSILDERARFARIAARLPPGAELR
jgi:hypothetical protein